MEEQHHEQETRAEVRARIGEESASVERKSAIGEETGATQETTRDEETHNTTSIEELKLSEAFVVATASISAETMEEIAETIATRDNANVDVDYSVAATLGSSVDGESVRTEDFAQEALVEERSKEIDTDFVQLTAANEDADDKTESPCDDERATMETLTQVCREKTAMEIKMPAKTKSEIPCSVTATLGHAADVDSVSSVESMRDVLNVGGVETVDASEEEESTEACGTTSGASATLVRVASAEDDVDTASSEVVANEASIVDTSEIESTHELKSVIEKASVVMETKTTAEDEHSVTAVAVDATSDNKATDTVITEESALSSNSHASPNSAKLASTTSNMTTEEPEHETESSANTPSKSFSSMMSRFAEKVTSKTGAHRTDSAAKLELNPSPPVKNVVHHLEVHEPVSPHTHRTPSAAKLDLSGSSPVQNVVHLLESHQDEENALESLKIRTKRDFFSEKRRSISVSQEKDKYNAQVIQRAKEQAEAKDHLKSPARPHGSSVSRKSSAMSSVRNMASRFEKKADQSLDNLSFRTVRSFFPTEKSIHVGVEKQKYDTIEKEKQSAKEAEGKRAKWTPPRSSSGVEATCTEKNETALDKLDAEDAIAHETHSKDDVLSTPTKSNDDTTSLKTDRTSKAYHRRHTVVEAESSSVRGIAHRFEMKRANSVVTAPVRTIDSFIVADSEASVRVSAEKAKYENHVQTSAPTKRTIDTFIVPDSEASVRVSAEKAKFETPEKLVKAAVRTIDTFIVPESEASVRVSAEKAKFETPEKLVKATVRTIDTFIVPDSEASVRVSAEKAKFESMEQAGGPVVRTIDTFIVPESEVSIHVAAEKAKLEALERQKQSELEAQAAIERQKLERAMLQVSERAKAEEASKSNEKVKTVEDVAIVDKEEEAEVARKTEATTETEAVKEFEATKEPKAVEQETDSEVISVKKAVDAGGDVIKVTHVNKETETASDSGKTEVTEVVKKTEVIAESEVAIKTEAKQTKPGVVKLIGDMKNTESKGVEDAKAATAASKTEDVKQTEATQVSIEAEAVKVVEELEIVKENEKLTTVEDTEKLKMVTLTKEAKVRANVNEAVQENEEAKVATSLEKTEVTKFPEVKIASETVDSTIPEVEVTVERQTFGDTVSTAQHVHWLSLPVSANPALARLHTVLSDHDPLTAYALYPSNPSSPSSPKAG